MSNRWLVVRHPRIDAPGTGISTARLRSCIFYEAPEEMLKTQLLTQTKKLFYCGPGIFQAGSKLPKEKNPSWLFLWHRGFGDPKALMTVELLKFFFGGFRSQRWKPCFLDSAKLKSWHLQHLAGTSGHKDQQPPKRLPCFAGEMG